MSYSSYSRETIDEAWHNASPIPGTDSELWRMDELGSWMHKPDCGNRHSQYGWEICDREGCCREVEALQWQNFVDKCKGRGGDDGYTGSLF